MERLYARQLCAETLYQNLRQQFSAVVAIETELFE